jgi:hypothetical protein
LFYSAQDVVAITYDDSFTIIEYVPLGLNDKPVLPFEKQTIYFTRMAIIKLKAKCFSAPEFNQNALPYLQQLHIALLKKLQKKSGVDRTGT